MASDCTLSDSVSIVIATRGRGASIVETLNSALFAGGALKEIIVVDQSTLDDTEAAVRPFLSDKRLRYFRSDQVGIARARNFGMEQAHSDIIFMTDDDCVLPPDFLDHVLTAFTDFTDAGIFFFKVVAPLQNETRGYTPLFLPEERRELTHILNLRQISGIGAGMAVRRQAVLSLGGFDVLLGAGGKFRSAEDIDITIRALLSGVSVVEIPDVSVVHNGYRTVEEFGVLVRRDWYGIGATYSKPLRTGRLSFTSIIATDLWRRSIRPLIANLVRLSPYGFASLQSFIHGFCDGWRQPLDIETLHFKGS